MHNEFNSYRIYYQTTPRYNWQARVYLYNDREFAGAIYFMKDGNCLPGNTVHSGCPRLHFHASKFNDIMNMMRHESPLYISLVPENGIGTLSTTDEPIGEEEDE